MSPYVHEDHEPWPGVLDSVPDTFRHCVDEPAFSDENGVPTVTACLWRETRDDRWRVGEIDYPDGGDPDGSAGLFELLIDPSPEAFQRFAEDYHEIPVDLEAVRDVYALRPLTRELASLLSSEVSMDSLAEDFAEIGYPVAD